MAVKWPAKLGLRVTVAVLLLPWAHAVHTAIVDALPLRFLTTTTVAVFQLLVFACVPVLVLHSRTSPWLIGASDKTPVFRVVALLLSCVLVPFALFHFHLTMGTPVYDVAECQEGAPMEVSRCLGRNLSFLQGRDEWTWMTGTPRPAACSSFKASAAASGEEESEAHRKWGYCSFDEPAHFRRVDCGASGLSGFAACYRCSYIAPTVDTEYAVLAVDAKCTRSVAITSINVEPKQVASGEREARAER